MKKRRTDILGAAAKGLLAAVVATLAGMLLMAAAVIFIGIGDTAIRILNQVLKIFAAALGTTLAVRRGGDMGLITGLCIGALYASVGYVMFICLGGGEFSLSALMGELTICAAAGGVVGVARANMKKSETAAAHGRRAEK